MANLLRVALVAAGIMAILIAQPTSQSKAAPSCEPAPSRLVDMINSGFLDNETLAAAQSTYVSSVDTTLVGGNIVVNAATHDIAYDEIWMYSNGQMYTLTGIAKKRSSFPDGTKVMPSEAIPYRVALERCVLAPILPKS